jgi:hypothetical protein
MRILHIDTGRELRGGQFQALLLMDGLRRRGVEGLLLARAGSPLAREAARRELAVAPLSWPAVWRESAHCDLLHCHDARAHTMVWLVGAWLAGRAPFVVSRRVAFPLKNTVFTRKKYRAARQILSISPAVTRALVDGGVAPERIALVPDGVEVPPWTSSRVGPIVALASDDPGKCTALLDALPLRVDFVRDLTAAFRSARIFLYASEMEGLGSAALLAMAHGVPVVASNVAGLRETIADGVTGLLADNTVASFRAAVARLENERGLAQRLAQAARAEVELHYSAERMVERTLACYRRILEP